MNGGLVSALEYIASEDIDSAVAGFWYFGLDDAARSLVDAVNAAFPAGAIGDPGVRGDHIDALHDDVHGRLEQIEDNYYAALPDDDVLEAAFRERLRESPGDFARLD
jgi:hypothetical protein